MTKPTKRERSESEGARERVVVSEVMLRSAAISYAVVAKLDPSHPNWRRHWRKLRRAAIGMVAEVLESAESPEGNSPSRALVSRQSWARQVARAASKPTIPLGAGCRSSRR